MSGFPAVRGMVLALVLLAGNPAFAQFSSKRPVEIDEVHIGLPPGRFTGERDANQQAVYLAKRGQWAPIHLRLKMLKEVDSAAFLRISTQDADDLGTTLVVPILQSLKDRLPGSFIESVELDQMPYVRSGETGMARVTVTVLAADGTPLSEPREVRDNPFRNISNFIILSLGSKLPGFDLPTTNKSSKNPNTPAQGGLMNGRVETAAITNVRAMPDQWFGYEAADLVVLTTGTATGDFLDELFDREKSANLKNRRDALLEWVRRGGSLVISVGSNASKLVQSDLFNELLPAPLSREQPSRTVSDIVLRLRSQQVANNSFNRLTLTPPKRGEKADFPVARFVLDPDRPATVTITEAEFGNESGEPIMLQSAFGLGRITVIGFDLDQSPFVDLEESKARMWDWLIRETASSHAYEAPDSTTTDSYGYNYYDTENEFASSLRDYTDYFEGVPVISFGWVALFIVLYTLLIGPIEYLFLKKIVGRLELTWITFPLIVISVSTAAYFTAYAIKGKDLRINKIDVVDYDMKGGRVYGRTWFTIFSPRIDNYTIAVEPKPEWAVSRSDLPPLVGWMGPRRGTGGRVLSSSYSYNVETTPRGEPAVADGLRRVPIQVWSTKAFQAQWSGVTNPGTPPIAAEFTHPPGAGKVLTGSFTNNLPVSVLKDAVLIYQGIVYELPTLTPGQTVSVPAVERSIHQETLSVKNEWFTKEASLPISRDSGSYNQYNQNSSLGAPISLWGALFHSKALTGTRQPQNSSLRRLDESWRLSAENVHEAILLAKVETPRGVGSLEAPTAESILTDPKGPSPTLLWLKGLPGDSATRAAVPGTLKQETYIRVFIPIRKLGQ